MNAPNTAIAQEPLEHDDLELDAFADGSAAANDAVPPSSVLSTPPPAPESSPVPTVMGAASGAGTRRRRVLTHEEEVALAQRIEAGEREAWTALLSCVAAAGALRGVGRDLRDGRVVASSMLRNAEEDSDEAPSVERLARMFDRAAACAGDIHVGGRTPRAAGRRAVAARDERRRKRVEKLAVELADMRFERGVFERIAREMRGHRSANGAMRAFRRGRNASSRALHEFVAHNFGLVMTYARRFIGQGLDLHDLVQEGQLGLIRAVEKFDWRRGLRFSTYAAWWVRQAMARALADQSKTIRVPVHLLESRHKLERVRRALAQQGLRDPSDHELARESGLPIDKVKAIRQLVREPLRLESPLGGAEDDGGKLADLIADPNSERPDEQLADDRMRTDTRRLLALLTPREQQLLRLRFGMDGGRTHTLEEVGKSFSLSRERVRQIEAKALEKLRAVSEERGLGSYLER